MDPGAAQRWLNRADAASPWLHEEVGSRMADRLPWFREQPASWLHWEPVQGGLEVHRKLRGMLPDAPCQVMARRLPEALEATREAPSRSWNPLHWGRATGPTAATTDTRVRMVWANMALHMELRPQTLLAQWHRQIETDGFLMFSCLGPDSLKELRTLYAEHGWPAPSHAFTDMHDWGDMLVHAGFAEPVMDMERITLSYSGADPLLAELRGLGHNLSDQRFSACRSRHWHTRLCAAIEAGLPRAPDGRLTLTFEIIYGHAFKPVPRVPMASSTSLAVDDMRAMLRAGRR
ncbi:biotin synthase [Hydrogenophaga sp.]|uniref:biotin synthase n=1 Tax=Hydrogenophaga sp. TaxID=1904254 RepID=UPI0025C283A0|nr:biotin synthase [Hydrogenophaga sp.]MBT9464857.1 biotin synthase [Hydrogenophaga sp.]